jgi:hypothetical protein
MTHRAGHPAFRATKKLLQRPSQGLVRLLLGSLTRMQSAADHPRTVSYFDR